MIHNYLLNKYNSWSFFLEMLISCYKFSAYILKHYKKWVAEDEERYLLSWKNIKDVSL